MELSASYAGWFALTAAIWVFRAAAAAAGTFVLFDWAKYRGHRDSEIPPHNRIKNSRAWAFASAGAVIGGTGLIMFDAGVYFVRDTVAYNLLIASIWASWAFALIQRAAARAEQPLLIYAAASLMILGGFTVVMLGGRPAG